MCPAPAIRGWTCLSEMAAFTKQSFLLGGWECPGQDAVGWGGVCGRVRSSFSIKPEEGGPCCCLATSLVSLLLLMSEDVSLHLSPILFACPAVKTGGVSFIPAHKVPKGKGTLMPVFGHKQLSLIIVFLLSLPVLLESQQMNMP